MPTAHCTKTLAVERELLTIEQALVDADIHMERQHRIIAKLHYAGLAVGQHNRWLKYYEAKCDRLRDQRRRVLGWLELLRSDEAKASKQS